MATDPPEPRAPALLPEIADVFIDVTSHRSGRSPAAVPPAVHAPRRGEEQ